MAEAGAVIEITPVALLREWALGLELDEWAQVQGALRDSSPDFDEETRQVIGEKNVGYCCLRVVCEIGIKYGLVAREKNEYRWAGLGSTAEGVTDDWSDGVLPQLFADWLGVSVDPEVHTTPWCPEHGSECKGTTENPCDYWGILALSSVNDAGARFPEIGRMIMREIVLPRVAEERDKENGDGDAST